MERRVYLKEIIFMFCIYDFSRLLRSCFLFLLFLVCCWFVFVLYDFVFCY